MALLLYPPESKQFNSNMHYKVSNNIIFEADESDESFLNSNPYVAIVTNAEPEHMDHLIIMTIKEGFTRLMRSF